MKCSKQLFFSGLLLTVLSAHAFGRPNPPWTGPGPSNGQGKEPVLESHLPLVRAGIEGSGNIWVGQAVPLNVEVIVSSWFKSAPGFPELEVPKAVILSPEAPVNSVVESEGKTFPAQSRSYLIFPQIRGRYTIPSIKVGVTYALPDGRPSAPESPVSSPLQFEAKMPPGAENASHFLTTDSFQISQSLDRKTEELKVGDSITRTVSLTAGNTLGMMLPALDFEAPDGIRIYPGVPKISEKTERGTIEAARVQSVTYILEKEGHYTLPEITILWWNPLTEGMNKARLPAMEFHVGENPDCKAESFASSREPDEKPVGEQTALDHLKASTPWVLSFLGLSLLVLILRRILSSRGIAFKACLAEGKRRRAEGETAYFKRFREASLSNDAAAALREMMFWLDHVNTRPIAPTLEQFAGKNDLPGLLKEQKALEAFLFAGTEETEAIPHQRDWSGRRFYEVVAQARKACIRGTGRRRKHKQGMLDLNPGAHEGSWQIKNNNDFNNNTYFTWN